tara:strand:+ start:90 stop:359 length:270 start_codon:yes stop_codon:yes gene_type:complete
LNQNFTHQLVQSIALSMVSVLRRTDLGFDFMLRLLDGVVLIVLFFTIIFCSLFGLAIYDRLKSCQSELTRVHEKISDLRRKIKWLSDKL